jgi:hypothetical protein
MELPGNIALLCGAVVYIFVSWQIGIGIEFIIPCSWAGFCARMVPERSQGQRQGVRTRHDAEGAGDRVPSILMNEDEREKGRKYGSRRRLRSIRSKSSPTALPAWARPVAGGLDLPIVVRMSARSLTPEAGPHCDTSP